MKKISAIGLLFSTIAVAGLCGCASKPSDSSNSPAASAADSSASQPQKKPKDKRPIEQRLVVGMTMDEVVEACGKPKNVSTNSDGSAMWTYNNSEMTLIPNYTLFGGRVHYVTVMFNPDGKVVSWSSGSSGLY